MKPQIIFQEVDGKKKQKDNNFMITLHYIIVIWQTLLSRATYIEVHD